MDKEIFYKVVNYDFPVSIPIFPYIDLAYWDHYECHKLALKVDSHPPLKTLIALLYCELVEQSKRQRTLIYIWNDGNSQEKVNQLLKLPERVLNVQDEINPIEWHKKNFKSRVIMDSGHDCQFTAQQNEPFKVQEYINCVMNELYDVAEDFILNYWLYPNILLLIVKAMADYFEEIFLGGRFWTT